MSDFEGFLANRLLSLLIERLYLSLTVRSNSERILLVANTSPNFIPVFYQGKKKKFYSERHKTLIAPFEFVKGILWAVMNLITNMMTYDELIDFVDEDQLSKKPVFFLFMPYAAFIERRLQRE